MVFTVRNFDVICIVMFLWNAESPVCVTNLGVNNVGLNWQNQSSPMILWYVFTWERAHGKQSRGHFKNNLEHDWMNLLSITFRVDQSDFILLPAEGGGVCCQKPVRNKAKTSFTLKKVSMFVFLLLPSSSNRSDAAAVSSPVSQASLRLRVTSLYSIFVCFCGL